MNDIELVCSNPKCNKPFTWSVGEQNFMQQLLERGKIQSIVEPKRCPDCRRAKRERFERNNNQK